MFYPPSAVCAEHEKSNAGNPISLRLRPLIFPLLVISFQRSAAIPGRLSHLHPFKETETPQTVVKSEIFLRVSGRDSDRESV